MSWARTIVEGCLLRCARRIRVVSISRPQGCSITARIVAVSLVFANLTATNASSSIIAADSEAHHRSNLVQTERRLRHVPAHISEFGPAAAPLAVPKCGNIRAPEALLTPDPLLPGDTELSVRVSFIVGSDGHVHSAFLLSGSDNVEDQVLLRAVRSWRYRPALCNGVPTDSEARVRFTLR